jgi:8-oxo-dGTP pyrophosphatase MutT (NUDIX family)
MEDYFYFMVYNYSRPFGYMPRIFVDQISWSSEWKIDTEKRFLTLMPSSREERSKAINETLLTNFDKRCVVRKWFGDNLAVKAPNGEHVLDMDRGGVDLFGVITHGVHLTGFVQTESGLKYWVPRRSYTKSTFPGLLDNFVAGSLSSGEKPIDAMVREVSEETGIPEEYTRANMKPCGTLTFQLTSTNDGRPGCQHQSQYVYEMELSNDVVPRVNDGEVDNFMLMSLEEVQAALTRGEFTPNRTLTYIAHFIRHGIVNTENEERIFELCARLHRKHDLFIV